MGGSLKPQASPALKRKKSDLAGQKQDTRLSAGLDEIEKMPVTRLRRFARTIPNLRIKGREISRADKATLLREIKSAFGKNQ
jgi:hypothetical protein